MIEIWKDIQGFEHLYQISNMGNVKSLNYNKTGNERIMKVCKSNNGYLGVCLFQNRERKTFKVHRLVAQAFISNPKNLPQINHKDEDKTNNRVDNLEWCTSQYNNNYGTHNERSAKARKGKFFSKEHIENISKAKKDRKQSQETIEKRVKANSIAVVQLDLQGNYIATHQSAKEVGRELGFNRSNITQCCKGRYETANGYKWMYLSEWEKRKVS